MTKREYFLLIVYEVLSRLKNNNEIYKYYYHQTRHIMAINKDLTPDQWKQLEDQRKMSVLVEMMKAKEREKQRLEQQGKVKYEYDSDEETEGGTWEHKVLFI